MEENEVESVEVDEDESEKRLNDYHDDTNDVSDNELEGDSPNGEVFHDAPGEELKASEKFESIVCGRIC
jgi:hypothetical protein